MWVFGVETPLVKYIATHCTCDLFSVVTASFITGLEWFNESHGKWDLSISQELRKRGPITETVISVGELQPLFLHQS